MRLCACLPLGEHTIRISVPSQGTDHPCLRVDGGCRYQDRVEVRAGLLTLLVWLFAARFYGHRQRRWRQLVRRRRQAVP